MQRAKCLRQSIFLASSKFNARSPPFQKANAVLNTDALVFAIMDYLETFRDLLSFISVNRMTLRVFQTYFKAAFIRILLLYNEGFCEIVTTLVIGRELRREVRFFDWTLATRQLVPRPPLTLEMLERLEHPVRALQKMTYILGNIEVIAKVLSWPNGRYLPYKYHYRTRPGGLLVHYMSLESRDCHRRIERNLRLAVWQLHLFSELFYVGVPRWLDIDTENLWAQVGFMSRLTIRELIEIFRLYRNLYQKTKKSKHSRFKALAEQLRIGEHGLRAVKDPGRAQVPLLWVKKHLIYQLSIGLPLILRVHDPPKAIKSVKGLDKKTMMVNAVKLHLNKRQQRIALWVQDVYMWSASSIDAFGRVRHEFSDNFTFSSMENGF